MKNFTEQELKEYAEKQAETIVIRSYKNGNSSDDRRNTNEPERKIIMTIIFGALLGINNNGICTEQEKKARIDGIIDCAEFVGKLQLPAMNGYDTIYIPLKQWVRDNI